jgi:hypothetical protein
VCAPEEIAAILYWLKREGTCLLLAPHHDVGFSADLKQRQMEYRHLGDPLVPHQEGFGQYTRSLMKGLGVPVHNTYGLRPARVKETNEIAPLSACMREWSIRAENDCCWRLCAARWSRAR